MKTILKLITTILGGIITINGVALFFVSNLNLGNFLTIGFGVVVLLVALFFKKLVLWLKIVLISGIGIAVVFSSFLIIYGKNDSVTHKEDALIVLGAAVHGKTPSLTLKKRLDKAVEYHTQNPDAIIVVTGGKGNQEDISEAEAMEAYLVNHGVSADKIIKESAATSTLENFCFSKDILDKHFDTDYDVAFITNEYHILRSSRFAKQAGLQNATHLHSNTNLSYLISGSLRECFAVAKYIIFKN